MKKVTMSNALPPFMPKNFMSPPLSPGFEYAF
jgi:hypothetical protein